jgi:hypothetical protein
VFPEEDPLRLAELVGVEDVCFGSDYPHPEGMFDPLTYMDEIESLPTADPAKIMGGNLAGIMRVASGPTAIEYSSGATPISGFAAPTRGGRSAAADRSSRG